MNARRVNARVRIRLQGERDAANMALADVRTELGVDPAADIAAIVAAIMGLGTGTELKIRYMLVCGRRWVWVLMQTEPRSSLLSWVWVRIRVWLWIWLTCGRRWVWLLMQTEP